MLDAFENYILIIKIHMVDFPFNPLYVRNVLIFLLPCSFVPGYYYVPHKEERKDEGDDDDD